MPIEIAVRSGSLPLVQTFIEYKAIIKDRLSHVNGTYDEFINRFKCSSEIADLFLSD